MISKEEKYIYMICNQKLLVSASQSIIRKKKSVLARRISSGDVKAILQAAKSRIEGSLSKEDKRKFCKLLCDFKNKVKSYKAGNSNTYRELLATVISSALGFIDTASGLLISFLWIIRNHLEKYVCPCQLNAKCIAAPC